ncbi:AmmeMemoRadiSam system radical SAM enzyme [Amphritea sp. 1_MG-2023]|uniref:AmmeMemoRadiSam system radical SAM enzyme n=1 Tax=Amphritea sp. 1_MG-2023 TaxID=3062670 RepID=UPI0026E3D18C|nr:AmmeMemoRadiSam system radical SAM enzyme [Amphritea sp. 1_MG-2023]MDO6564216.1 AmmeMemoRadiSam system radical SAM enzyme [Amphritea sp. 1_MG-2023]
MNKSLSSHATHYWHALSDGRVQCDVCPHQCQLQEGQRGLCYVRGCENGQVVLYSYARSSGFCIDPIEKKPLNHFLPGTPVLSFGTAGCNLSCKFCQNWDMSKSRQMDTLASQASPQQLAQACVANGCRAIAYTYNDPVIFMEYAIDVAQACHAEGIYSVAVSAGYILPAARERFFHFMDATNIDLKGFNEHFYRRLCGGHLQPVLETLIYLVHETDCWVEITNLIIPGENDDPAEIEAMCEWIHDQLGALIPLHFSAFHPDYKLQQIPPTTRQSLENARQIALNCGLKHVYTGNIAALTSNSTFCSQCGLCLIERHQYQLGNWNLDAKGRCRRCQTPLAGRFEASPGHWGARRQPLKIS